MAVLDLNTPVDRVRLNVADTQDLEILPDNVYEYLLEKNSNNEVAATKEAAYLILGQLSMNTRVRIDRLETYGNMAHSQYLQFIKEVIKNPSGSNTLAGIYCAGLSIDDILANQADTTIVQRRLPIGEDPVNGEYAVLQNDLTF